MLALSLSVPLGHAGGQTWANYQLNSARHGGDSQSLGLSGVTLADNNLSWSLRQGYATRNQGSSGSAELDYRGGYGEADAGYAWDRHSRRLSYGLSGALTAHRDGITLSQPLGETVALVKAPGIAGASLVNQTGVRTDLRGYTLVPYVRPFRVNELSLDPLSLPNSVELTRTSAQVIPRVRRSTCRFQRPRRPARPDQANARQRPAGSLRRHGPAGGRNIRLQQHRRQ
ncbi:hypothetical protein HA44_06780 [Mixta gaviniae]|nr:hypothetical protein HA44_06780 [Mixta gaviniae]